jgi:hypothetical protein
MAPVRPQPVAMKHGPEFQPVLLHTSAAVDLATLTADPTICLLVFRMRDFIDTRTRVFPQAMHHPPVRGQGRGRVRSCLTVKDC